MTCLALRWSNPAIFLILALSATSPARAGFSYYTSATFNMPPDVNNAGFKVNVSGGGAGTALSQLTTATPGNALIGTTQLSTGAPNGQIVNYAQNPPKNDPTMAGPIMVNVSTTIMSTSGLSGTISVGGVLTGGADYTGTDFSKGGLSESLTLASDIKDLGVGLSGSTQIGNEIYTLTLLPFPSESSFDAGIPQNSPFLANANFYGSISVSQVAVPEPSSVALLTLGVGIIVGSATRARRLRRAA